MSSNDRTTARRRGRFAETISTLYLRLAGWRILARGHKGVRGTGVGEVDIIARRGQTLAFIEVKARADVSGAVNALTSAQQNRIVRAAEAYLQNHPHLASCDVRFDFVAMGPGFWPRHIPDAWRP
jgi:putative endonuclease